MHPDVIRTLAVQIAADRQSAAAAGREARRGRGDGRRRAPRRSRGAAGAPPLRTRAAA